MSQPDLSVIIPMHNASGTVVPVIESFLAIDSAGIEVVVVDDASTDDSVERVRELDDPRVVLLPLTLNHGAGQARNHGFAKAGGRYSLFFDADDEIHPESLTATLGALDDTGASVAMMPYRYRRPGTVGEGMNSYDIAVWEKYVAGPRRLARLDEVPRLLGFTNYPWNKVVRTEHYRRTGLRFGSTQVHNDILGHWLTLVDAETVLLLDQPLCTHVVQEGGKNLTNRESRARLNLLDALDETYTELCARPEKRRRYANHYWDLALRVIEWASGRITPEVRDKFSYRVQEHLFRIDLGDFHRIRFKQNPGLANRIVRRTQA
ncbi:hypothetical protein GCM10022199_09430 [Marihabitans asiaticum]|uniref:Glycosyl transferase family 2 n=1 Tax=Marihabitans asiaticum TaxID=415218 RepID=A0A560WHD3_9MICO|nr:glycosyltransferase family 2 protein [Marihabitans asiaticum]TWD16970.1 glycosyl transferase family 2 [Marihabitans asiaticum]